MAIAYPVTPPAFGVRAEAWSLQHAGGVSESPYTFSQEVYEHAGKRLQLEAPLPPELAEALPRAGIDWKQKPKAEAKAQGAHEDGL